MKTAYIIKWPQITREDVLTVQRLIQRLDMEEIQIADEGEKLYTGRAVSKVTPDGSYETGFIYEPVSVEVKEPMSPKQISGTSDDYEYVLLKEGDEIREGDEILGENGTWRLTFAFGLNPVHNRAYRRRVLKSKDKLEIQKKLEPKAESFFIDTAKRALEETKNKALKEYFESIKNGEYHKDLSKSFSDISQKNTQIIELQNKIEDLEKELSLVIISRGLAEGEVELKNREIQSNLREIQCGLSANKELREEIEELKKQVPKWSEDPFKENEMDDVWANAGLKNIQIYYKGMSALIPIPKQQPAIDPAEEAWENSNVKESLRFAHEKDIARIKSEWIKDFRAAKGEMK